MVNSFKKYLIEIGKYPLLTQEQEIELAKRYRDGDLSAREQLINSNLKLVVSIAKNYKNTHFSIADLVSEGNLGLMQAVEKFNPDLNYRFSTCATPWIKQAISKAITDKGRNIRIPAHIYQLLAKLRCALKELEADGHTATDKELAAYLKVDGDKIPELKRLLNDTISLETPLGDENKETLGDLQADMHSETPTEYVEKNLLKEKIARAISKLKPREQTIIKMRYGLGTDGDPEEYFVEHTLEDIGAYLNITRERVRQIEKEVLSNIKLNWDRI